MRRRVLRWVCGGSDGSKRRLTVSLLGRGYAARMAYAVTAPPAVKIASNVEGADVTRTVKNTGANAVYLSRDPAVTSAATSEFSVAAAASSPAISLAPGEELYAVCAAGLSSTVEVI